MLNSILSGTSTISLSVTSFLLCSAVSLALGIAAALVYMYKSSASKPFVCTLSVLPLVVQAVIMLVNGNLGAGVAVAGAFSLVRFRSAQGSAKDIGAVFLAMAIGLATGMGYLLFAALLLAIVGAAQLALTRLDFGQSATEKKQLKITIAESQDYNGLFDDLFEQFAVEHALTDVRTTNMGSLYRLTYEIELKDSKREKEMIDEIRCRNGNLEISCGRVSRAHDEL